MSEMTRNTDLTGLPIDDAIAFVHNRMAHDFSAALALTRAAMARDGLSGEAIEALIEHRWRVFEKQRAEHLDELRAVLLRADNRLH